MARLMVYETRRIIDDFAAEITKRKSNSKPQKGIINFRDDIKNKKERDIYEIPIDLLRYRKDNGRIACEVISYQKVKLKTLDETTDETQNILYDFLCKNDPEKTEELIKAIRKDGQNDPAIITCDGFLINGNRRKMVLQKLSQEDPSKFISMKVIILPGKNDEGGPPTIKEIELLENRYQLQRDGKSEYTGLNRALSIKRKMECGISLEDQLLDDPICSGMRISDKEFRNIVNDYRKRYLDPLERADAYLDTLGRPEYYDSIKERWQAFIDFSNFFNGNLKSEKWQNQVNITTDDIGTIEDVAYKIIRKQFIKSNRPMKLHYIMRELPKLIESPDAKNSIFTLEDEVEELTSSEKRDKEGNEYDFVNQDRIWGQKNEKVFAMCINNAYSYKEQQKENESAMSLLQAAYNKLTHDNMVIANIQSLDNVKNFMKLADKVQEIIVRLKQEAYERVKNRN